MIRTLLGRVPKWAALATAAVIAVAGVAVVGGVDLTDTANFTGIAVGTPKIALASITKTFVAATPKPTLPPGRGDLHVEMRGNGAGIVKAQILGPAPTATGGVLGSGTDLWTCKIDGAPDDAHQPSNNGPFGVDIVAGDYRVTGIGGKSTNLNDGWFLRCLATWHMTSFPSSTTSYDYTLTAAPAANSYFTGWGGACSGTAPTCVVSLPPNSSVVVRADFDLKGIRAFVTYPSQNDFGSGTVTASVTGTPWACRDWLIENLGYRHFIYCGAFASATTVTLTAVPDAGSRFRYWIGDCAFAYSSTDSFNNRQPVVNTCTVTVDRLYSVGASFGR